MTNKKPKPSKTGRPRLSKSGKPSAKVEIMIPPEEKEVYRKLATAAGMTLSEWFRSVAEKAAKKG